MTFLVVCTPAHLCDPALAVAAVRGGDIGLCDLGIHVPTQVRRTAITRLAEAAGASRRWGVRWDTWGRPERTGPLTELLPDSPLGRFPYLLLGGLPGQDQGVIGSTLGQARRLADRVLVEGYSVSDARQLAARGVDGVVVKGEEAGGRVGNTSSFVLVQALARATEDGKLGVPWWVQGAFGPETALAGLLAGAAGIVLCEELWLTAESPLDTQGRRLLAASDGSDSVTLCDGQVSVRLFARQHRERVDRLRARLREGAALTDALFSMWRAPAEDAEGSGRDGTGTAGGPLPVGQGIAFARTLASRHAHAGEALDAYRRAARVNLWRANRQRPLRPDGPLAAEHNTRYPIVQGPMTRVSDEAAFAESVADHGALPTLALALLRAPQVRELLAATAGRLGNRSWGVGILGFVPPALRREQLQAVQQARPAFAIIAGGRPGQAAELERLGVTTYLHVPSPGLLTDFLEQGARRFVLEGRECGGHTGPRSSVVLWQSAIDVLVDARVDDPERVCVLFAGGVHDALSAAMVQALAVPLVNRGMRIGVLMGTAYLYTEEAVRTGAIVEEYQRQAVATGGTTLLETGVGHAIRCADTAFTREFQHRKEALLRSGKPIEEVQLELEMLNVGRLRVASKGLVRESAPSVGSPGASSPAAGTPAPSEPEGTLEGFTAAQLADLSRLAGIGKGPLRRVDDETQRREGLYMLGDVAALRDHVQPMAQLHHDVAVESGRVLAGRAGWVRKPLRDRETAPDREPVAVVGMACVFPGAPDLRSYWTNILGGVDAVREAPPGRWRADRYLATDRGAPDGVYCTRGAFLEPFRFDPLEYRIPPSTVPYVEPVQLLATEVVRRALDDAGWQGRPSRRAGTERGFPSHRTAVVFGAGGVHDLGLAYAFRAMLPHYLSDSAVLEQGRHEALLDDLRRRLPRWTEDSFSGFLPNVVSGRVANVLDLQGPNFTVDAACASSLGALQTAVEQLRAGLCDVAVAGGADWSNSAFVFLSFARTQALTPGGVPRPFDDRADGIVLGEGVAAVVLKRLSDAERDGDRIYALLRGLGSSSDGRARGLTAPRAEGQVLALRRAYEDADVEVLDVGLVEAHATGTAEGDRVELTALTDVMGDMGPRRCAVGSVKSMIGHTKSAAGMAGLVKTVLALSHRMLPPTLHVEQPNTKADLAGGPLYVNTEARPWPVGPPGRRVAGVSAFGFGGTNFHAVLEEYPAPGAGTSQPPVDLTPRPAEVLVWTGDDRGRLAADLRAYAGRIRGAPGVRLDRLARSRFFDASATPGGVPAASLRLAIAPGSVEQLLDELDRTAEALEAGAGGVARAERPRPSGCTYLGAGEPTPTSTVCFLFPGQGAQYVGMFSDLVRSPFDTAVFDEADELLTGLLPGVLSAVLYPPPAFGATEAKAAQEALNDTGVTQPALGVVDVFALETLRRFGLRPAFAAGHSYGEYVALHAAGVYGRRDLLLLSARRGEAVRRAGADAPGGMAAVVADPLVTEAALRELGLDAVVANMNAPRSTVIAGPESAIDAAVELLPSRGMPTRRLPVTAAFHSRWVADAAAGLGRMLEPVAMSAPQIPVFSNVTAAPYPDDPARIRALMTEHLAEPVRFTEQVRALHDAGARVFVEAGPGRILTGLVGRILEDRAHVAIAFDNGRGKPTGASLANLLAEAWSLGLPIDLEPWFAARGLEPVPTAEYLDTLRRTSIVKPTDYLLDGSGARPARNDSSPPSVKASDPGPAVRPTSSDARPLGPPASATTGPPAPSPPEPDASPVHSPGRLPMTAPPPEPGDNGVATPAPELVRGFQSMMSQWMQVQETQHRVTDRLLGVYERLAFDASGESTPARSPAGPTSARSPAGPTFADPSHRLPATQTPAPVQGEDDGFKTPAPLPEAPAPPLPPLAPIDEAADSLDAFAPPAATAPSRENGAAASPDAAPGVPPVETFRQDLLKEVAARTGYPEEMLKLDQPLEAELGVDSIKMMEIFGALRSYHHVLGSGQDEESMMMALSELKTLQDIIDRYASQLPGSSRDDHVEPSAAGEPARTPATEPEDADGPF